MVDFFAAFTYSWFATTWQGGHVVAFFSKRKSFSPRGENAIVLDHGHGRRDVMCKPAIAIAFACWKTAADKCDGYTCILRMNSLHVTKTFKRLLCHFVRCLTCNWSPTPKTTRTRSDLPFRPGSDTLNPRIQRSLARVVSLLRPCDKIHTI